MTIDCKIQWCVILISSFLAIYSNSDIILYEMQLIIKRDINLKGSCLMKNIGEENCLRQRWFARAKSIAHGILVLVSQTKPFCFYGFFGRHFVGFHSMNVCQYARASNGSASRSGGHLIPKQTEHTHRQKSFQKSVHDRKIISERSICVL